MTLNIRAQTIKEILPKEMKHHWEILAGLKVDCMEVNGKIAIVTSASSGIGLATARLLSMKGAKVTLASILKKLEELS